MRRSKTHLERSIVHAKTKKGKALAHYELAVFHDNNSREREAIPHYKKAIAFGLDRETEAKAYAWLASSCYKTGKRQDAVRYVKKARKNADKNLRTFLDGLEKRAQWGK